MNIRLAALLIADAACLSGCGHRAETYTLYRTSSIDHSLRIHWGTFDAQESDPSYNRTNCEMAARLLTANMKALNGDEYDPHLGFWCEPGRYSPKGSIPRAFARAFPTDA